ncbi:hypothetical protein Tco_1241155, partial [Tanacetum coccineum]
MPRGGLTRTGPRPDQTWLLTGGQPPLTGGPAVVDRWSGGGQRWFRWRLRGTVHPRLSVRGWEYEVQNLRVLEADVARCHWWIQLAVT